MQISEFDNFKNIYYNKPVNAYSLRSGFMSNCKIRPQGDKGEIIDALLHKNLFKMPDGRQFYEASEKELELILNEYIENEQYFSF